MGLGARDQGPVGWEKSQQERRLRAEDAGTRPSLHFSRLCFLLAMSPIAHGDQLFYRQAQ